MKKKTVTEYLREVDYSFKGYEPSDDALAYVNFIKLVNGGELENRTPLVHLKMLDNIFSRYQRHAIMCFRGFGKTTLIAEYLFLYIAVFGKIPNFGEVNVALYVSDSLESGAKNLRKNIEFRYNNSEFLQQFIIKAKFTDTELYFKNKSGKEFVVKLFGSQQNIRGPLALDEIMYMDDKTVTMKEVNVGDYIYMPNGKKTKVIGKSEIFNDDMYELVFSDGRKLKVNKTHINVLWKYKDIRKSDKNKKRILEKINITTEELLTKKLKNSQGYVYKILPTEPVEFSEKKLILDPYLLGLYLGDGSFNENNSSPVISGLKDDCDFYFNELKDKYDITKSYFKEKSGTHMLRLTFKKINKHFESLKLRGVKGDCKFIPNEYMFGSVKQRRELLAGLLDTDGTISKNGYIEYSTISKKLANDVAELARSIGYIVSTSVLKNRKGNRKDLYRLYIRGKLNPFKLKRKADIFNNSKRHTLLAVNLVAINKIEKEPSQCILVDDECHEFLTTSFIPTHNTKALGKRPELAILDDLIGDLDANSPTILRNIENNISKAIDKALHPKKKKIILIGTPFGDNDPLCRRVESGTWNASVYPVCEQFPTEKENFRGAWEDRFPYDAIIDMYEEAKSIGQLDSFYQEMMLQVFSDDERLVRDRDIQIVYEEPKDERAVYYITTDFATNEKESSDYSVISVWKCVGSKKILVDGICRKQLMDQNVKDLFRLVEEYNPLQVGIETSGQQGGFISWIRKEMNRSSIWFNIKEVKSFKNKLQRFQVVLPEIKAGNILFSELMPYELKSELMNELTKATRTGFKSKHDDVIDTVSQLQFLDIIESDENYSEEHNSNETSYNPYIKQLFNDEEPMIEETFDGYI